MDMYLELLYLLRVLFRKGRVLFHVDPILKRLQEVDELGVGLSCLADAFDLDFQLLVLKLPHIRF